MTITYSKIKIALSRKEALVDLINKIDIGTEGVIILDNDLEISSYREAVLCEYKENENLEFYEGDVNSLNFGVVGDIEVISYAGSQFVKEIEDKKAKDALSDLKELQENCKEKRFLTPSISSIKSSCKSKLGSDFSEKFMRLMEDYPEVEVEKIAVVVGAELELKLYDVAKCVEESGLSTKATVSRTQKKLENKNLITTTNEPIDISRPRSVLHLAETQTMERVVELIS